MQTPEKFKRMGLIDPPENWNMPPKNIGGHDIVRFFSLQFMNETAASILIIQARNFSSRLGTDLEPLFQERRQMENNLRNDNLYFYTNSRSIHMDYKIMRSLWQESMTKQGSTIEDIDKQFNESMSAEQFFEKAQSFVKTWWDIPIPIRARS